MKQRRSGAATDSLVDVTMSRFLLLLATIFAAELQTVQGRGSVRGRLGRHALSASVATAVADDEEVTTTPLSMLSALVSTEQTLREHVQRVKFTVDSALQQMNDINVSLQSFMHSFRAVNESAQGTVKTFQGNMAALEYFRNFASENATTPRLAAVNTRFDAVNMSVFAPWAANGSISGRLDKLNESLLVNGSACAERILTRVRGLERDARIEPTLVAERLADDKTEEALQATMKNVTSMAQTAMQNLLVK